VFDLVFELSVLLAESVQLFDEDFVLFVQVFVGGLGGRRRCGLLVNQLFVLLVLDAVLGHGFLTYFFVIFSYNFVLYI
jgi:hypothetical protein